MKKMFDSKYRSQLIAICIVLGTIPTIIVGLFASSISVNSVKEKLNASNAANVAQAQMTIEQQLTSYEDVVYQFLESPVVDQADSIKLSGNNFEIINGLERSMMGLPMTRLGIKNIALVNTKMDWIVGSDGNHNLSDFMADDNILSTFNEENKQSAWLDYVQVKKTDYPDCVTFVRKASDNSRPYMMMVNIPYNSIYYLIPHHSQTGSIMIVSSSGCIIEGEDMGQFGKNIVSTNLFKRLSSSKSDSGSFEVPYHNVQCSVNYIKSDYNGWYYLNIWSVDQMTHQERLIGWFTVLVCVSIIVLIFLISLVISNRLYAPVGRIYGEIVPSKSKAEGAKANELTLIEENVNSMISLQTKLNTLVYKQSSQVKEYFTVKLMIEEVSQSSIDTKVKIFDYPKNPGPMVLLAVKIDTLEGTDFNENDRDLLLYAINNIINELLDGKIVTVPVIIRENQVTIISVDRNYKDGVYRQASEIKKTIRQALNLSVSIGISSILSGYTDIHRGYGESIEALQYQILLGKSSVIFLDDIRNQSKMRPIYPTEIENELLDAVVSCDQVKSTEMVHQFMDAIFTVESNRQEYKAFLQRLLINLMILQKSKGDEIKDPEIFKIEKLSGLPSRDKMEKWLNEKVVGSVIDSIEKCEHTNFRKICDDILDIIHKGYDTKITLESCAEKLNYHPSYIRRVLKREMGINFSEYLMQYRMNIAKQWLVETELRVGEIAEKLTYENTENFIRSFKKVTGMTPSQFRKSKIDK